MTQAGHADCARRSMCYRHRGFTLFELTIVIAVISLLLGLVIAPLASQNVARQLRAERNAQQEIRDALIGYAIVNRRLPCPDNDRDGEEDLVGGIGPACDAGPDTFVEFGFLPWVDLGVQGEDTWGRLYQYRVHSAFVFQSTPGTPAPNPTGLDLQDTPDINVDDYNDSKALVRIANDVAAVILSLGPNGNGGTNIDGDAIGDAPPSNTNEASNIDGDEDFVSRNHTPVTQPCNDAAGSAPLFCEFDDVLTWVPPSLLFLRMVEGGALP